MPQLQCAFMQKVFDASTLVLHLMRVIVIFDRRLCPKGYFAISIESLWDGRAEMDLWRHAAVPYAPINKLR